MADSRGQGTGELVGELSSHIATLVRQEFELARTEIREEARRSATGLALLGGAALCGGLAVASLHGGVAGSLARRLSPVGGGVLLATAYGAGAAALASAGAGRLRERPLIPRRTMDTLKEDLQWAAHPTTSASR